MTQESDHREIALEGFVYFGEDIMPEMKLHRGTSDNPMPLIQSCHLDPSQTIFLSVILNAIRFLNDSSCNKKTQAKACVSALQTAPCTCADFAAASCTL